MEPLYYQTPYVKEFDAIVTACRPAKHGFEVELSQTGFYPEGGGQPYDTGILGGAHVTAVHDVKGEIVHYTDAPLTVGEKHGVVVHETDAPLEVGSTVHAAIDWEQRFSNMQQHTGEHIISGLIHAAYGYDNVGFHMGHDEVTVDLNGPLNWEQLKEIEKKANAVVWANLPVQVTYPGEEELKTIDYRSKKELTGQVRIVEIPGADICACCGTHVDYTGEIGVIKVLSLMNYKGGVRFSMLCGDRALENFEAKTEQMQTISNLLSAKPEKAAEAVSHLKEESGRKDGEINHLWQRILTMQADVYPQGQKALAVFEQGMTPVLVRQFANLLLEQEKGETVLVCSGDDASGYNYTAGSLGRDMRAFGKELNARLQGRGGGSTQMVQGTFRASREEIEKGFQELARIEA